MSTYIVQPGDTLAAIARKFLGNALRYRELAALNNIADPNIIRAGQIIQIPTEELQEITTTATRLPVPTSPTGRPGATGSEPLPGVFALEEIGGTAPRDYMPAVIAGAILFYAFSDKKRFR